MNLFLTSDLFHLTCVSGLDTSRHRRIRFHPHLYALLDDEAELST